MSTPSAPTPAPRHVSPQPRLRHGIDQVEHGAAEQIVAALVPRVLPRMAAWAARPTEALPPEFSHCCGFRTYVFQDDGSGYWELPRSNTAERISAYLYLARRLGDERYHRLAVRYADAMIDDPYRGIYQGEEEDGRGQVWYWRDVGTYMTNYTMRVPPAMLDLADATGAPRYRAIAEMVGAQLIRSQRPTGILREGWKPSQTPPGLEPFDPAVQRYFLSEHKINSRIGHVVYAFARLHRATGDAAYLHAIEHFLDGFERYQYPDGTFPQDIHIDRVEVLDPARKGHFMHYILNAFAPAACLLPGVPRLAHIAERLAAHLVQRFRQCGALMYGDPYEPNEPEASSWSSTSPEATAGMAWMTRLTGDPAYREVACRLALQGLLASWDCPDEPDRHGGVPGWSAPWAGGLPGLDGHGHFWTLLGLKALEETAGPNDALAVRPASRFTTQQEV